MHRYLRPKYFGLIGLLYAVSFTLTGQDCGLQKSLLNLYEQQPTLFDEVKEKRRVLVEQEKLKKPLSSLEKQSLPSRIIPVVFHVLHQCGEEQISYSQIEGAIQDLNNDFNAENADRLQVGDPFYEDQADVNIRFELAGVDPYGNATTGITYTESFYTNDGNSFAQTFKKMTQWPRETYLNVWVIKYLGNASGYAFYPEVVDRDVNAFNDGIVIRYEYLGTTGASNAIAYNRKHILAHEVGHWLGLQHTWGDYGENDSNYSSFPSVGQSSNCSRDDFVDDTPNTIGDASVIYPYEVSSCSDLPNTCSTGFYTGASTCSIGLDPPDNIFNMMDYGAEVMFTEGQKTRMWSYLDTTYSDRNLIGTTPSLTFIPNGTPTLTIDGYFFQESDNDDGSIYNVLTLELSEGRFKNNVIEYPLNNNIFQVTNLPSGYTLKVTRDGSNDQIAYVSIEGNTTDHTDLYDIENLSIHFESNAFQNLNYNDLYNATINNLEIDFKDFQKNYRRFALGSGSTPLCANAPSDYQGFYLDDTGYLVVTSVDDTFYMLNETQVKVEALCTANTSNLTFIPEGSNVANLASTYDFKTLTRAHNDTAVVIYHSTFANLAGQTGYVGIRITQAGCFTKTMYGWLRLSVSDDGSQVCVLDAFYDTDSSTTTSILASTSEVPCDSVTLLNNPYFEIDTIQIDGVLLTDLTQDANSQINLNAGTNYPVYFIQKGNGSPDNNDGKYRTYWAVWIDFNDDGFYDFNENIFSSQRTYDAISGTDIYNSSGSYQHTIPNIEIPNDAVVGTHKMLVLESLYYYNYDDFSAYYLNPCGTIQYGSTQEFNVTIGNSSNGGTGGNGNCPQLERHPYLLAGNNGQANNEVRVLWRTDEDVSTQICYRNIGNTTFTCQTINPVYRSIDIPFQYGDFLTQCDAYDYETFIATTNPIEYEIRCMNNTVLDGGTFNPYPTSTTQPLNIWVTGDGGYEFGFEEVQLAYNDYIGDANNDGNIDNLDIATSNDLILMLGDNAYNTGADNDTSVCGPPTMACPDDNCVPDGSDYAYQRTVFNPLEDILKNQILWTTIGNHEVDYSLVNENLEAFFDIFPSIEPNKGYYSFDHGDVHFVCLNSEIDDNLFVEEVTDLRDWLINDLSNNQSRWTIAYLHHPIHSASFRYRRNTLMADANASSSLYKVESDIRAMMNYIAEVLDDFDVDLVMSGHNHYYERSFLIDGYYNVNDTNAATFDETDSTMLLDDGCDGCLQNYLTSNQSSFDYTNFECSSFEKEDKGTVYLVMGSSSNLSNPSSNQDFFNHPIMRPFETPSYFTDLDSTVFNGGRGLLQKGSGHLAISKDSLVFEYVAYDDNTNSFEVKDKFIIHKPSECTIAGSNCDCNDEPNGTAFIDNCGNCVEGSTGLVACVADCNGDFGGTAFIDNCGICVQGNTGLTACITDCNGDLNGIAFIDICGNCVGGNTGILPCNADCNGDLNGTAFIDNCGNCVEGNTGLTACLMDCNNDVNGTAFIDNCGNCVGGNTGIAPCNVDCNGDLNGVAFIDICGNCVGGNTGILPCNVDCNGDLNGVAFIDNCGNCVGGNTGLPACMADCNGDFSGNAYIDICGNCVGGNTGLNDCSINNTCQDDSIYHYISTNGLNGNFQAQDYISSSATITNNVYYKAGDNIDLMEEFYVPIGTIFDARIEECIPTNNRLVPSLNIYQNTLQESFIELYLPKSQIVSLVLLDKNHHIITKVIDNKNIKEGFHNYSINEFKNLAGYSVVLKINEKKILEKAFEN